MLQDDEAEAVNAPLIHDEHVSPDNFQSLQCDSASPNAFIWALTLAAGISGLLFGYDTGVISSTLVSIGPNLSLPLTTLDKSLITSCTSLFALIASPVAGILADKLGRKRVILVADILFIVGALWQATTTSVSGMIVGRSIVGLAVGGASLVVPLYISELSPSAFRGMLVTLSILFITLGQVVAYTVGWILSTKAQGWRWMVGFGAAPAVLQFGLLVVLPETPRWLVKNGDTQLARIVLGKVYGRIGSAAEEVFQAIGKEISEEEANSLMYFSATIFALIGFSSPTLTALSIAITNFTCTLIALLIIDHVGRRRILLSSIPIMAGGLLLCSISFTFLSLSSTTLHIAKPPPTNASPSFWAILILIAMIIYVCGYAIGLGNIAWQQSELFPLSVRSLGSGLATATNWGSNFVVGLTFLPMMQYLTPAWTFFIYALVCVLGWGCAWRIYPETKGLGLEDVRGLLKDGWGVKESLARVERGR